MDTKAIIQSLITAILSGLLVMYGTQQSIMTEINIIRNDIKEVKQSVKDDIREVKQSVAEMRKDVYVPRR